MLNAADKPLLLIVDDDPLIVDSLGFLLHQDFEVVSAATRPECISLLRQKNLLPQLALIDLGLPPLPHRPDEGFALISDLLAHAPEIKIVVLSGQSEEAHARHARTLGAADFIAKPADPGMLRQTLRRLQSFRTRELFTAEEQAPCPLVGASLPMQKLREQIRQYAESPFPVLIEGESGSGKDIVAGGCLHFATTRRNRPYLALNCAAISPGLVEPTLFGYAKGAFTGAAAAKSGYFEDAAEGTLFLDEIGELPLELQPKLLRVLENGEFQRVGETQLRVSRARVVAATNRDLRREVKAGRFRADLYHRLSVFTIGVPSLRDLGADKMLLLDHYRDLFARQAKQPPFELSTQALALWQAYVFPGNVRELRNIVIRLTAKYPGQTVAVTDLETELDTQEELAAATLPSRNIGELTEFARRDLGERGQFDLDATLRLWEQGYIEAALALTHGNVSQAAKLLGINRTTLYNRLEIFARENAARALPADEMNTPRPAVFSKQNG